MDVKNSLHKSPRFMNRFDAGPFDVPRVKRTLEEPAGTSLTPSLVGFLVLAGAILVMGLKQ